jgi:hypothetical protein
VPLLPPADDLIRAVADIPLIGDLFRHAQNWDYQPVGTLRYIESAQDGYRIIPDHLLLMTERYLEIAAELAKDTVDENLYRSATPTAADVGAATWAVPALPLSAKGHRPVEPRQQSTGYIFDGASAAHGDVGDYLAGRAVGRLPPERTDTAEAVPGFSR